MNRALLLAAAVAATTLAAPADAVPPAPVDGHCEVVGVTTSPTGVVTAVLVGEAHTATFADVVGVSCDVVSNGFGHASNSNPGAATAAAGTATLLPGYRICTRVWARYLDFSSSFPAPRCS
jgi:hypothetical protein